MILFGLLFIVRTGVIGLSSVDDNLKPLSSSIGNLMYWLFSVLSVLLTSD